MAGFCGTGKRDHVAAPPPPIPIDEPRLYTVCCSVRNMFFPAMGCCPNSEGAVLICGKHCPNFRIREVNLVLMPPVVPSSADLWRGGEVHDRARQRRRRGQRHKQGTEGQRSHARPWN